MTLSIESENKLLQETSEQNRESEIVRQPQTIETSFEPSDSYETDTNGEGSGKCANCF